MGLIHGINNKLKDNLRFRLILILGSLLLILIREPALLLYPRMVGEEGTIFYAFAFHHSLYDIFFANHVGYFTLFNSMVSALQAKAFSVESAAIISTYLGLLIQLIPIYIITFTTHIFWNNPFKKISCVFVTIITTTPDLWLNTTNSHFIFGFITFLIMIISTIQLSAIQKHLFRLLLFIGVLSGPASLFLVPAFLLKAYYEKSKEKYIQAGIILVSGIIQGMVILHSLLYNNMYHRLSTPTNFKNTIMVFFSNNFSLNIHPISLMGVSHLNFYFGIIVAVLFIWLWIINTKDKEYNIIFLSFIIISVFSTLGSLGMAGGYRYGYTPSCILLLILLSKIFDLKLHQHIKKIVAVIFTTCIITNTINYRYCMRHIYGPDYPKWKDEIAKWRVDTTYNPQIHPLHWKIKL